MADVFGGFGEMHSNDNDDDKDDNNDVDDNTDSEATTTVLRLKICAAITASQQLVEHEDAFGGRQMRACVGILCTSASH